MGSISTSGIAWMAIAGAVTGCIVVYTMLVLQGVRHASQKHRQDSWKRSFGALTRAGRGRRLQRFQTIARDVVTDVEAALQPPLCHRHARSFLPILADVRKRGQSLLQQQTTAHRVTSPDRERDLAQLVMRLFVLESQLKSLPKPSVTIEEVLSGKFE